MSEYAVAASAPEESSYWSKLAVEEARRAGAVFIQAATGRTVALELVTNGLLEDAIEAGLFAGRGMLVQRELRPLTRENFDGLGIEVEAEFRKLSPDKRRQGDRFSLIAVIVPTAMWVVCQSLTDQDVAISAGQRVASACRQLAADPFGDQELWRTVGELFELACADRTNPKRLQANVRAIEGADEGTVALRVLGYLLAVWHASPEEAVHFQLASIDVLLQWFRPSDLAHRLILLPFIESYWQRAMRESRFAFRSPNMTVTAIEAAMAAREADRVQAILVAAASGFRIQGLQDVVQRLRLGCTAGGVEGE